MKRFYKEVSVSAEGAVLLDGRHRQHGHGGGRVELRKVARGQVGPEAGFEFHPAILGAAAGSGLRR